MRAGRHYVQFTVVSGSIMFFGVIRPGWGVEGGGRDAPWVDGHCFYYTCNGLLYRLPHPQRRSWHVPPHSNDPNRQNHPNQMRQNHRNQIQMTSESRCLFHSRPARIDTEAPALSINRAGAGRPTVSNCQTVPRLLQCAARGGM